MLETDIVEFSVKNVSSTNIIDPAGNILGTARPLPSNPNNALNSCPNVPDVKAAPLVLLKIPFHPIFLRGIKFTVCPPGIVGDNAGPLVVVVPENPSYGLVVNNALTSTVVRLLKSPV